MDPDRALRLDVWVWLTFMWIIGHQDHPMGFKVVHGLIAVGSIAFGLAAGWIGYRGLRPARPAPEGICRRAGRNGGSGRPGVSITFQAS